MTSKVKCSAVCKIRQNMDQRKPVFWHILRSAGFRRITVINASVIFCLKVHKIFCFIKQLDEFSLKYFVTLKWDCRKNIRDIYIKLSSTDKLLSNCWWQCFLPKDFFAYKLFILTFCQDIWRRNVLMSSYLFKSFKRQFFSVRIDGGKYEVILTMLSFICSYFVKVYYADI